MFDVGYFPPNTPPAEPVGWVERSETHRCSGGISER
jgi:hypothetical protein